MSNIPVIAARNFLRNLRRYRVLLVALALVVATLVVLIGIVTGMQSTLRGKAQRYFAGDVVVLGMAGDTSRIDDPDTVESLIHEMDADIRAVVRRSTFLDPSNANLFHAGFVVQQRRFLGVEWGSEAESLGGFRFVAGGLPQADDTDAVVISRVAAEAIQAQVGDRIVLSTATDRGRQNTVELTVTGIYDEQSFFGYATYLHRVTLNRLLERPDGQVNEIGVYLSRPAADERAVAEALTQALSGVGPTVPVITSRARYTAELRQEREERHFGVVTLSAQLADMNDLIRALTGIAVTIIILFLLITMIGVSNTYSMITFERTREIGTLRALGMQARSVVSVFVFEAFVLSAVGLLLGLGIGGGLLVLFAGRVPLPAGAASDLFLLGGTLTWQLPAVWVASIAALTTAAGTLGALRASVRAGRIHPVDALRH